MSAEISYRSSNTEPLKGFLSELHLNSNKVIIQESKISPEDSALIINITDLV